MEEVSGRLAQGPYRLIIEPGRTLVADAGILLALYGSHHEIVPVEMREGSKFRADVVGPLCETGDFLAQNREMPEVRPGDLVAIMTTGAYGFVLASNYNSRPRPAEVLISGAQAELVRPRERVEDLMAGELESGSRY